MNCTGSCNQGRNCTCGPVMKMDRALTLIIVMAIVSVIAAVAIVIDTTAPGAGRWAATILAALCGLAAVGWLLWWLAECVIDGIDWMTRMED